MNWMTAQMNQHFFKNSFSRLKGENWKYIDEAATTYYKLCALVFVSINCEESRWVAAAEERIIRYQSSVTLTISGARVSVRLMEATKLFGPNPEGESLYLVVFFFPFQFEREKKERNKLKTWLCLFSGFVCCIRIWFIEGEEKQHGRLYSHI